MMGYIRTRAQGCFRLRAQDEQRRGSENAQDMAASCQQVGLATA